MNRGLKLATGAIATTLNSDDMYANETIVSQMVEFMQSNDVDAAYGDLVYVDPGNNNSVSRFWKARCFLRHITAKAILRNYFAIFQK